MIADHRISGAPMGTSHNSPGDFDVSWQAAIRTPATEAPVWTRTVDGLCFAAPGVALYRCTPDAVTITPFEGASSGSVEALLIATALPAACWLGGRFMLHAAAVLLPEVAGALAIAGASGSGKSRIAAALVARNARLVADDSLAIRWRGGQPVGTGLPGGYHLAAPGTGDRSFHVLPPERSAASAALNAVVVLDDARERRRLTGVDAVAALLKNRHRANAARYAGLEPRSLEDAARLARRCAVYRWSRQDADALLDDDVCRTMVRGGNIDD